MRSRRIVAIMLSAILATGCSTTEDVLELEGFLAATAVVPHRLIHDDATTEHVVRTIAHIEDGYRDAVRVLVDGDPVVDWIQVDDDIALRVLDPLWATIERESTELADVTVADAFAADRWVVDVGGAPPEAATNDAIDQLRTSLDIAGLVQQAILGAREVVEWSPELSSPATPVAEDRFPLPDPDERRYDLRRPPLPAVATTAGQPRLADVAHVRKMAVYVRNGTVSRVHEHVEVLADAADALDRYLVAHLEERGAMLTASTVEASRSLPPEQRSTLLLGLLSELRAQAGLAAVVPRLRSIEVLAPGADVEPVELPRDAIAGRLHGVTLELPT